MHNVFHVLLLEQDTTRKKRLDKQVTKLDLKAGDIKEYEVEAICNSPLNASKLESSQLPGLYYLVVWKGYLEDKNIGQLLSTVQQLKKQISCFHKKLLEKPIATSLLINSASPMAKPSVMPTFFKRN